MQRTPSLAGLSNLLFLCSHKSLWEFLLLRAPHCACGRFGLLGGRQRLYLGPEQKSGTLSQFTKEPCFGVSSIIQLKVVFWFPPILPCLYVLSLLDTLLFHVCARARMHPQGICVLLGFLAQCFPSSCQTHTGNTLGPIGIIERSLCSLFFECRSQSISEINQVGLQLSLK